MPIPPVFREPNRPSTDCPVFRPFIRVPYSIFLYLRNPHSISRHLFVAFLQQMIIYFIYATDFSGNRGENPCSGPGSPAASVRILFEHISVLFLFLFPVILFFLNIFFPPVSRKNKFSIVFSQTFVTLAHGLLYSRSVPKTERKSL